MFSEKLWRNGIETELTALKIDYMRRMCCKYDFVLRDQPAKEFLEGK
jgi:hypothetical protein